MIRVCVNKSSNHRPYFVSEIHSCHKVTDLREANLDGIASAAVLFRTDGKPSTWFTPGRLVERAANNNTSGSIMLL